MEIGIGLPNAVPGVTGRDLTEWILRSERAGFSCLGSIGRVGYPTYEELSVFAAAAGMTERIRFLTNILIAPTRSSAELAKQAATVDQLSGGRLTLGLGVGRRKDDYALTGRSFHDRGRRFDEQLRELRAAWAGEPLDGIEHPVCPRPVRPEGVPIMIGGTSEAALRRVAREGVGWAAGGSRGMTTPDSIQRVHQLWRDAGRTGTPRITALAYFVLADDEVTAHARRVVVGYYSQMGPTMAARIGQNVLAGEEAVARALASFVKLGIDELVMVPAVADLDQVERLADIALG